MKNIFAVARHTFSQCIRMKIAVAFIVLLAVCLVALPYVMTGDGTLAGNIRTFLSYSVSITGVLLSIVTVLITVSVVASDISQKYIYLIIAKPLGRWEYIIGRWLGVVVLNALLLAIAAGSIFLFSQYLREKQARNYTDRRTIETEIFTARQELAPATKDFDQITAMSIAAKYSPKALEKIYQEYEMQMGLTREKAEERFYKERKNEIKEAYSATRPGGALFWAFEGLPISAEKASGAGSVESVDVQGARRRLIAISVPVWLGGRLIPRGPVTINGVEGVVVRLDKGRFLAAFNSVNMQRGEIANLKSGDSVEIQAEPTIQFRYKVSSGGGEKSLKRTIEFYSAVPGDAPADGSKPMLVWKSLIRQLPGDGPTGTMTTVTIAADKELSNGNLIVRYVNKPPVSSVSIKSKNVSLLYRVGGFTGNFFRAIILVFCQLVFLSALGIFMGSFLSFPVGVLSCLVLLVSGWIIDWLSDALGVSKSSFGGLDFTSQMGTVVTHFVKVVMPNFTEMSPSDKLVDGINISWRSVGQAVLWSIVIRTTFYLAVGCLIFRKRELARVQV